MESKRGLRLLRLRRTHKGKAERDILLVETARLTGMRRFELANLKVRDIDFSTSVVVVRGGKGEKDRAITLVQNLVARLESFCEGKGPEESVFGLAPATISNKIRTWANKAGVSHIHVHSLRHEFGTRLAQRGVGARTIQALLGHSNMATSQRYIDVVGQDLRDAVETLEKPEGKKPADHGKKSPPGDTRLETVSIDVDPEYVYTIASFGGSMYIGSHYRHNQERVAPD